MDNKSIIRYIEGKATEDEQLLVLDWIESSDENRRAFNKVKNLWALANLPKTKAAADDVRRFSHSLRMRKRRQLLLWSGIAASILIVSVFFFSNRIDSLYSKLAYINSQEFPVFEFKTNKGIKGMVTLPDGSKVWLNSDSYIKCPSKFEGGTRKVEFSGEGYFEVVKNAKVPMVINLGNNLSLHVKGTTFNLSSYKNDGNVTALLLSGAITFVRHHTFSDKEISIKPNEKIVLNKVDEKDIVLDAPKDTFKDLAWKDGWLVFDEAPMQEVLKKLERWHGVTFNINDPAILSQKFTGRFKEESISQILEMMNKISLLDYDIKGSVITLKHYQ